MSDLMQLHHDAGRLPVSAEAMEMNVRFPQGLSVEASFKGFHVLTDQPAAIGGGGTAPSPFDLFLASIGTCAGYYAMRFCQARGLPTEGVALRLTAEKDPATKRYPRVSITVELPPEFPEKYRDAIVSAAEHCSVKKHLLDPPEIAISAVRGGLPRSELVAASKSRVIGAHYDHLGWADGPGTLPAP
jgi:putative redox protein